MPEKPLCIDLFAGLGGWTRGFLAEGYDCIGFDIERHQYGEKRYPAQLVLQDVLTLHGSQFRDAAVIVGPSPCQEFNRPEAVARNHAYLRARVRLSLGEHSPDPWPEWRTKAGLPIERFPPDPRLAKRGRV